MRAAIISPPPPPPPDHHSQLHFWSGIHIMGSDTSQIFCVDHQSLGLVCSALSSLSLYNIASVLKLLCRCRASMWHPRLLDQVICSIEGDYPQHILSVVLKKVPHSPTQSSGYLARNFLLAVLKQLYRRLFITPCHMFSAAYCASLACIVVSGEAVWEDTAGREG